MTASDTPALIELGDAEPMADVLLSEIARAGERFSVESCTDIARVALDVSLPHLDRFFDYKIPEAMAGKVSVGCRIRARFAGRLVSGFVVELPGSSDVEKLSPLNRVISSEKVLFPEQIALIRAVADHYAGTFSDVMRLGIPPRHGATEDAATHPWPSPAVGTMPAGGLLSVNGGEHFLTSLSQNQSLRAHWGVMPRWVDDSVGTDDWTRGFLQAGIATLRGGRSVLIVVPDVAASRRMRDVLASVLGIGCIAELHAELGPAARYRNYLAVARGQAKVLVGTRGACYAPMHNLGLICLWDDGDDLLTDQRAPYPHARDVVAMRATQQSTALLFASYARSAEIQQWIERSWLVPLAHNPAEMRHGSPAVRVAIDSDESLRRDPAGGMTRLPREVFETIRKGLASGPVLVQVPRTGYLVALSCQQCRTPVRCPTCQGPVGARRTDGVRRLTCRWCGRQVSHWTCSVCGGQELRAPVVGSQRTAEELGKAFPQYRLVNSSGDKTVASVGSTPALVIATPGAEPIPESGYAACVLLDATLALGREDLRAAEETYRRWMADIALVIPGDQGGSVCIVGPAEDRTLQGLVRLDPQGLAARELEDRRSAAFPPTVTMLAIEGSEEVIADVRAHVRWPDGTDELGPVPIPASDHISEPLWRLLVRIDRAHRADLVRTARHELSRRSAKKLPGAVRVRVDPLELF